MVSFKKTNPSLIREEDSPYTGLPNEAMPKAGSPHPVRPFVHSIADTMSTVDILKWRTAWCTYRNAYVEGSPYDDESTTCDASYVDEYLNFREQKLREPFHPQHVNMAYTDSNTPVKERETEEQRASGGTGTGIGRRYTEPYTNSRWASQVLKRALHSGDDEGRDAMVNEAFALAGFDVRVKGQEQ